MGSRRVALNRLAWAIFLGILMASSCLAQPSRPQPISQAQTISQARPIQDRMRTWRMPHKHPNPVWLNASEPHESDSKERIYPFQQDRFNWVLYGKAAWRPDPSAQVDEIKARLYDQAKLDGWK